MAKKPVCQADLVKILEDAIDEKIPESWVPKVEIELMIAETEFDLPANVLNALRALYVKEPDGWASMSFIRRSTLRTDNDDGRNYYTVILVNHN